jgi:hypothetical protein
MREKSSFQEELLYFVWFGQFLLEKRGFAGDISTGVGVQIPTGPHYSISFLRKKALFSINQHAPNGMYILNF